MKIRTLIVDDEAAARDRVRSLLEREGDVEIVGECETGAEALTALRTQKVDLLFLDIQMPEMDGFDVLRRLGRELPVVIFVTAFDHYAVKAFEVHALDYLLKPFKPARLSEAVTHARQYLASRSGDALTERIRALLDERAAAEPTWITRIAVRQGERVRFVKADDVDWIEASGNYVVLHVGDEKHMLRETLGAFETKLSPRQFLRLSRSVIVNLERVLEVQPGFNDEHYVVLKNGPRITMTRGLRELQERLRTL
jgi:two-component system, LytTR family, response regulator